MDKQARNHNNERKHKPARVARSGAAQKVHSRVAAHARLLRNDEGEGENGLRLFRL